MESRVFLQALPERRSDASRPNVVQMPATELGCHLGHPDSIGPIVTQATSLYIDSYVA
jgi:hypothetical protein